MSETATTIEATEQGFRVVYHSTCVVENIDNRYILNTGGYRTTTTKRRINKYTPEGLHVFASKGNWFVAMGNNTVPFTDGMVITCNVKSGMEANTQ